MTILRLNPSWRLLYFLSTGGLAALVHVSLVFVLVSQYNWPPLLANILGFLLAFQVSFWGHRHLTFAGRADNKRLRMTRFFWVASSAGLVNEGLYYLLLQYTLIPWLPALLIVLSLVAVYTFLTAQFFAIS